MISMMAGTPTRRLWFLLTAVSFGTSLVCSGSNDNWVVHFVEIKAMMSNLDVKINSLDSKVSSVDILGYAFKMNTIDNSIKSLNTRFDQMAADMHNIKESLKNLPASQCQQPQAQNLQEARVGVKQDDATLVTKLDDYGKKLMQSHRDLKDFSDKHHTSLGNFSETVKNGFSKVISKVDSVLEMEGRMSSVVPLIRQLSASTNQIGTEVAEVTRNVEQLEENFPKLVDTTKSLTESLSEMRQSLTFPVAQISRALQISKDVESQLRKLADVEQKVAEATTLSGRLSAAQSTESLPAQDKEMIQNLKKTMSMIQNSTDSIFLSLPHTFQNIKAIIADAHTTMTNRTQCHNDYTVSLEIANLREKVLKQTCPEISDALEVFHGCRNSVQSLVDRETPNLKNPLRSLISYLEMLLDNGNSAIEQGDPTRALMKLMG